jgi:serine/threonine-protein kinase
VEIPEAQKAQAEHSPWEYQCAVCRQKAEQTPRKAPPRPKRKVCATCGKDIARESGAHRQGELLCATCRADPGKIVELLLTLANRGEAEVKALAGYRLVRELGRGGMGSVSLIRHERLGDEIALKIMLPRVAADERSKALFLRETENTKVLKHPQVVQMHDFGCTHGVFFFTLEYCNGGSVQDILVDRLKKHRGPLPLDEACGMILQALDGLDYIHQVEIPAVKMADGTVASVRGLVHRDVKPGNLFLVKTDSAPLVKLGDYGLAKAFDAAGLSGQSRTGAGSSGTCVFMPRQQVTNFKYAKPEVDVWAMAASLYQLLTGAFPREFPKGKDPWMQVLQTDAVPIRQRNKAIPKRVALVIDQALVDRPEIGFKTALAFKQALEGAL